MRKTIDNDLVERLLAFRTVSLDDTPCPETDFIARVIAGTGSPEEAEVVSKHLSSCGTCREAVLSLSHLTATSAISPLSDPNVYWMGERRQARLRRGAAKMRLIAAVAAAVLLVFGAYRYWSHGVDISRDAIGNLSIKGDEDALFAAVERRGSQFTLRPLERLKAGDHIGFFYSTKRDGYIAVVGVDSTGKAKCVFPSSGSMSASIPRAERKSLSAGALVQQGHGCEWLVAVFSDKPLALGRLERAAVEAWRSNNSSCELTLHIAEARTVFVLPYVM